MNPAGIARCLIPGCSRTTKSHAAMDPFKAVHHFGQPIGYATLCGAMTTGLASGKSYICVREDQHDGDHNFLDESFRFSLMEGLLAEPEPVAETAPVTVTHDGRNKPAFQHLLNRRREAR